MATCLRCTTECRYRTISISESLAWTQARYTTFRRRNFRKVGVEINEPPIVDQLPLILLVQQPKKDREIGCAGLVLANSENQRGLSLRRQPLNLFRLVIRHSDRLLLSEDNVSYQWSSFNGERYTTRVRVRCAIW